MHTRFGLAAIVLSAGLVLGPWLAPFAVAQPAEARAVPLDPSPPAGTPFRLGLLGPGRGTPEADTLAVEAAARLGVDAVVVFEPTPVPGVTVCDVTGVSRVGGVAVVRWSASDVTSTQSLERLAGLLSEIKADSVLVAVDQSWWSASADPEGWNAAHAVLASHPQVRAVIAVGGAVARDDGERDGIRYLGLPPRSGMGPRGLDRFARPAVVLAVGGAEGLAFSMIEPDAVRDAGSWLGGEADDAIALRGAVVSRGDFAASPDGGPAGSVTLTLRNPTQTPIQYTLGLDGPEGWAFSHDRVSGTLAEGASESIEIAAESPSLTTRPTVEVRGQLRLPLRLGGEQAVPVSIEVPVQPSVSPEAAGASQPGGAIRLDSRSGVMVDVAELKAPFTVECWVRGDEVSGEQVLLSAAGLELVWADTAGLAPSPSAVITAADDEPVRIGAGSEGQAELIERWVHVALCIKPGSATFFVDGKPVDTRAIPSGFSLRGPVVIGGVADEFGRIRDGFSGRIDELRVSTLARYDGDFTPSRGFASDAQTALLLHFDRAMGPVVADDSPSRAHGWVAGRARVEAEAPSP